MGFYHTLKLEDGTDIGGYSKGGSKGHWYFAFAPEHFQHTVQEARLVTDIPHTFIGYVTTVEEALKRLSHSYQTLDAMGEDYRRYEDVRQLSEWKMNIEYLSRDLRRQDTRMHLILNQTDGFEYNCLADEQGCVIGYEPHAFRNGVDRLWERVRDIEKRTLTFDGWLAMATESHPDETIPMFYGEVAAFVADDERSYGPNPVTEWFFRQKQDFSNNPREMFAIFCAEWPAYYEKEDLDGYFSSVREPYGVMDRLIGESYEAFLKYRQV